MYTGFEPCGSMKLHCIVVEYDASRLTKGDIAFMLRGAGIRLQNPVGNAA